MPDRTRFPIEAWVPLLAGLLWLWNAPWHGTIGFLFSVVPGCLLLGSGVSMLLMPGDRRITQFAALGGFAGAVLALPALFAIGFFYGLALVLVSLASAVAAGAHSIRIEPPVEGVPAPEASHALSLQVACDEALLSVMLLTNPLPQPGDHARIDSELSAARELFAARGWLEKPEAYHQHPPALTNPEIRSGNSRGIDFEHLSFDSEFEPHPDEPGRDRWLGYGANRRAHAWVLRHDDSPRPWLMCVHGYRMGFPLFDLAAFAPEYFHERLGLNMIVPTLPLHGERRAGRRSGDGFIGGELLDTVHAEAQAMWDMRRLLGWLRAEGAPGVGLLGLSLGGYNAALLACLEADLQCAILGVPLSDFARAMFRHGPPLYLQDAEREGIDHHRSHEVLSVVSPLVLEPKVPLERRAIFAGIGDRLVPADQPRDLWRHWGEPSIEWYQGGHVTFRAHAGVRRLVVDSLRGAGLAV
jgi:dienelactone hydrolase